MKKLLLSLGLLALRSPAIWAQVGPPTIAVMQLSHGSTTFGGGTTYLVISRGTAAPEKIEFKGYLKNSALEPNAIQQALTRLYTEGYHLKSTYATVYQPATFILIKEP